MTTPATPITRDDLARAEHRSIRTTWRTTITKHDKYEGESTILLVLETSHNKSRKIIESELYVEEDKGGYSVRVFGSNAGSGITIDRESVARFNANTAREMHRTSLRWLEEASIAETDQARRELAAAWAARV